jgi:hypothetical protein
MLSLMVMTAAQQCSWIFYLFECGGGGGGE